MARDERRHELLAIAVVAPGNGECPIAEDLAVGLAQRGHRVQICRGEPGYERVFRRLRAGAPDAVSQHAGDPQAFSLAEGLTVLHTLHAAPSPALVDACLRSRAGLAAPSVFSARQWQTAGVERIRVIPGGVPQLPLPPAVVRPVALVADRAGAMAALRAGLGMAMLGTLRGTRQAMWHKLAHSAVLLAASGEAGSFDSIAAQAQLAGCPVVGYASGALPEIVEDGRSGFLVAAGDERALAAAVRRALLLDRHLVRESARPRLRVEPMLDRYESELRAIARRSAVRLVA